MKLRRRWIKAEKPLPPWLKVVNGKVLKPETPVHCRQLFAGDEQFRQSQLEQLRFSDLATHLISSTEVSSMQQDYQRLGLALRKCGFERKESTVCTSSATVLSLPK